MMSQADVIKKYGGNVKIKSIHTRRLLEIEPEEVDALIVADDTLQKKIVWLLKILN